MAKKVGLLGLLLGTLLLCACASPITSNVVSSSQAQERILTDVRTHYRNASLIISGICKGNHIDANGAVCYDLTISEIYAGTASPGDTIHCPSGEMTEGEQYLLFLGQGADVNHAEDVTGFSLLPGAPLPIVDNEVIWDGKRLPLNALQKEIDQLSSIISAPAPVHFYSTLSALTEATSEIFIGRVERLPELTSQSFSIRNGGAVEKVQYDAAAVTIEAYGSIKGSLQYGQRITFIHCPERVSGMLDSATLQHTQISKSQVPRLQEGGVYLFFLNPGPDSKQDNYFCVNPVQGFVPLSDDTLFVSDANTPLRAFHKLTPLVKALQSQDLYRSDQQNPALVVEK